MAGFRQSARILLISILSLAAAAGVRAAEPFAVPTFHSLGLYWSPAGGAAERPVTVKYRKEGEATWRTALPMRYNPIAETDLDRADYRGSIVSLAPGAKYEIRLSLGGTSETAAFNAATWNEEFPVGTAEKVASRNAPLEIKESGAPGAYRVYDGTGSTIDVRHGANSCITVNASYVILRGITLKGAGITSTPASGKYAGAIQIAGGHDIIIERCDISDWGRPSRKPIMANNGSDRDSGVVCNNPDVARVIIQRCRIHHPHFDTNNWYEPVKMTHPAGPQCISFNESAGNHVFRYNEFYSDADHMFNDVIGGGSNASHRGFPGPDTDIYCNLFSHAWDDGIEVEGSDANVRVWGNYITETMMGLGNAPVTIGPLYFWRNVMDRSLWRPGGPNGQFVKMGFATGAEWMTGHQYLFHNTIFQGSGEGCAQGIGGSGRVMKHTTIRNNILQVKSPDGYSISKSMDTPDNDYDYDLYNGKIPQGQEKHGIKGEPKYVAGAGYDAKTKRGVFALADGSPGRDAGEAIPNFSDGFSGKAPDMGAQESGSPALQYGVEAVFTPAP